MANGRVRVINTDPLFRTVLNTIQSSYFDAFNPLPPEPVKMSNTSTKSYTAARIRELANQKIYSLPRSELNTREVFAVVSASGLRPLTRQELHKQIRDNPRNAVSTIRNGFGLVNLNKFFVEHDKAVHAKEDDRELIVNEINEQAAEAADAVMLGDDADAKAALASFRKFLASV